MSPSVSALQVHRMLVRLALSFAQALSWIFVFQYSSIQTGSYGAGLVNTLFLYALAQIITTLATPFTARLLRRGARRLLLWGTLFIGTAWVSLAISFQSAEYSWFLLGFAILLGLYRAAYWLPYSLLQDLFRSGDRVHSWAELLLCLMPALGGYLIASRVFAPETLLAFAALALLVSLVPLFSVGEVYEKYVWGYRETFGELFEPRHRHVVMLSLARGIEGAALLFLWPVVIFLTVGQSYALFGAILAVTLLIAGPVARLLSPLRIRAQETPLLLQATLAASPWVLRLVSGFPLMIIASDSYGMLFRSRARDVDLAVREQTADNGTYVDEFSALREIAMALGRLSFVIVAALLISYFSFYTGTVLAFLLAGCAAIGAAVAQRKVTFGEF